MRSPTTIEFLDDLRRSLDLDDGEIPSAGEWSETGNTIGMLALRLNLLTIEDIDRVLDVQEQRSGVATSFEYREMNGQLFGQLAVELGLLTGLQVERLLAIQEFNRQLHAGLQLVVAGRLDLADLAGRLAEFHGPVLSVA